MGGIEVWGRGMERKGERWGKGEGADRRRERAVGKGETGDGRWGKGKMRKGKMGRGEDEEREDGGRGRQGGQRGWEKGEMTEWGDGERGR